ncbi:hypothetical protein TWF281_010930 [Arthrobotrys megalospora]
MSGTTNSSKSVQAMTPTADGQRPRVDVPKDLDYSKRTYVSSPFAADPWNPLRSSQTRHGDLLARVDSIGLSQSTRNKL